MTLKLNALNFEEHLSQVLKSSDDVRIGEIIYNYPILDHLNDNNKEELIKEFKNQFNNLDQHTIDIAIIGFPFDEGCKRNGGRIGAKEGPKSFRKLRKRAGTIFNAEYSIDCSDLVIVDLGDVTVPSNTLEDAHKALEEAVFLAYNEFHANVVFVIGGGNDESYPNAMGLLRTVKDYSTVGVVNIDAHLDVRDKKDGLHHSGSPFRRLLQTEGFESKHFVEFAAQGTQCSLDHVNFVEKEHNGKIYWLSKEIQTQGCLKTFKELLFEKEFSKTNYIFTSFDLDSINLSYVLGVSCPSALGLTAQDAFDICFESGKCERVKLFDLSEYNPIVEEYNTGKVVSGMFVHFCMGYALRKNK
ncbi:hypothetical protein ABK040_001752 [Willaertia magna]